MDREEGEMSDEEAMQVDDQQLPDVGEDYTMAYKADQGGLAIQKLEKVDASKLEERAQRFGVDLSGTKVITQKQIDELYKNFGISGNERHFRLDTLHLSGVDGLSTQEVFKYLQEYRPISLEWINTNSCNIVCQDHISAALAMLVHTKEIRNENLKQLLGKSEYHWREGMPHEKVDSILVRFATNSLSVEPIRKDDMRWKLPPRRPPTSKTQEAVGKNPWGDLCQTWGVYDHQEIFNRRISISDDDDEYTPIEPVRIKNPRLANRLGKRTIKSEDSDSSSSSTEWTKKIKAPRMKMRADEEEKRSKKRQKKTHQPQSDDEDVAPLSIEVLNTELPSTSHKEFTKLSDKFQRHDKYRANTQKNNIHSRLGSKVYSAEEEFSDDSSKSDHNVMSRVQKVTKNRSNSTSDVWSRLALRNESTSNNDLRQTLKSRVGKTTIDLRDRTSKATSDLRDRIGKPKDKGVSLRIEVDNEYFSSD